jgi:hypothetical protein
VTDYKELSAAQLVEAYNIMADEAGKKPIKKFRDRKTAIARCEALDAELGKGKKPEVTVKVKRPRGRPSASYGKALFVIPDSNPRFPGSFGYHSWNIIQANPGIVYEDYLKAGGRNNDLRWDLAREFVRAENMAEDT